MIGTSERSRSLTAQRHPVGEGQHHVEQDDVRLDAVESDAAREPVGGGLDREPILLERHRGGLADDSVILDQQHTKLRRHVTT